MQKQDRNALPRKPANAISECIPGLAQTSGPIGFEREATTVLRDFFIRKFKRARLQEEIDDFINERGAGNLTPEQCRRRASAFQNYARQVPIPLRLVKVIQNPDRLTEEFMSQAENEIGNWQGLVPNDLSEMIDNGSIGYPPQMWPPEEISDETIDTLLNTYLRNVRVSIVFAFVDDALNSADPIMENKSIQSYVIDYMITEAKRYSYGKDIVRKLQFIAQKISLSDQDITNRIVIRQASKTIH